jgi:hypothetical protein
MGKCLDLEISQEFLLASHPLLKLQTAGVLSQLLRTKWGFQEWEAVETVLGALLSGRAAMRRHVAVLHPTSPSP